MIRCLTRMYSAETASTNMYTSCIYTTDDIRSFAKSYAVQKKGKAPNI